MIAKGSHGTQEFRKALEEACGLGIIVSSADGDTEVQRGRTAGEGPQERSPYALEPHTVSSLPRGALASASEVLGSLLGTRLWVLTPFVTGADKVGLTSALREKREATRARQLWGGRGCWE